MSSFKLHTRTMTGFEVFALLLGLVLFFILLCAGLGKVARKTAQK